MKDNMAKPDIAPEIKPVPSKIPAEDLAKFQMWQSKMEAANAQIELAQMKGQQAIAALAELAGKYQMTEGDSYGADGTIKRAK